MRRQRVICICIAFLLLALTFSWLYAMADSGSSVYQEGDFSYILTDAGAELTEWKGWEKGKEQLELVLPSSLNNQPLVGIGRRSMGVDYCGNNYWINEFNVIVPEGVRYLSEAAFEGCDKAAKISLPSTLVEIGEGCFFHVYAEIEFPNGNSCFSVDNGFLVDLRSQTLLYAAPSSCDFQLPSVQRLGNYCLYNWLWGQQTVILPQTLVSIGTKVFYDLPDLEQVSIPEGVTTLSEYSFFSTNLKEIKIPSSVAQIPANCFLDSSLRSVTIPEGVTYIGEYAFYDNRGMPIADDVILPESMQFVGYCAFPEGTNVIALSSTTHFETLEEYNARCAQSD